MKHNLSELQEREQRYAEVQKVLLRVLFANLAVTILKIAVGIFTGVLAVAADGVHSLVDSSSNLIGWPPSGWRAARQTNATRTATSASRAWGHWRLA